MAHTSIATHCPPPPPTDAVLDLVVLEGGVDVVPPMLALGDTLYGRWGCLRGNVPTAVTGHCSAELHCWWGWSHPHLAMLQTHPHNDSSSSSSNGADKLLPVLNKRNREDVHSWAG
jgi:hypothetical protein